jgi:uncharacterized protein (TIGR03086 family)
MHIVDLYRRSLDGFTDRVAEVAPDQWDAPTPCEDWDVRALVNHVVSEDRWTAPLMGGATIAEVGGRFDGDLIGYNPTAAATAATAEAYASVVQEGALERVVHLSFGDTPAEEYVRQLLADHLVHAWDLAVAIGVDSSLDPEVVQACAEWFAEREEIYREGGAIGPRAQAGARADAQDQLIAAFGRDPGWTPK